MKIASESDANGSYISAFNANLTDYSDAARNMFVYSFQQTLITCITGFK